MSACAAPRASSTEAGAPARRDVRRGHGSPLRTRSMRSGDLLRDRREKRRGDSLRGAKRVEPPSIAARCGGSNPPLKGHRKCKTERGGFEPPIIPHSAYQKRQFDNRLHGSKQVVYGVVGDCARALKNPLREGLGGRIRMEFPLLGLPVRPST